MTTPSLLQIDDHDPLVFYSPNNSWIRGGNSADFDGTSTLTSAMGASATLTFTGTGISVWGTIQYLSPNTTTYVLSSYSINDGPTTTFNATEATAYKFQQKLFQSAELNDSGPHTLVATLDNNGTFFIDYFLVIPSTSSSVGATSTSGSPSSTLSTTASAGAQSQSNSRVALGPAVGGSIGGLALLVMIAILAVLLCRKRRKDKDHMHESQAQEHPVPFITPALPMQQHQLHEGSDRVSEYQSLSPPTSSSGATIIPPSKAANLFILSRPSPRRDSLHSRPLTESPEPPGYNE